MRPLLEIDGLDVVYPSRSGDSAVVRRASLRIAEGEALGLVGESAAGKSTLALAAVGLVPPPGSVRAGSIRFRGEEIRGRRFERLRGRRIGMVFQEPGAALNPVLSIGSQVAEAARVAAGTSRRVARERAVELLRRFALPDPGNAYHRTIDELSGGQRQRALLAVALAAGPSLIIADEPTSSLDASLQAEVLDLLVEQRDTGDLALLLVTHDFGVVARACDRVAVLYAGEIVEEGPVEELLASPVHPYTQALVSAATVGAGSGRRRLSTIPGSGPSPSALPAGCAFHPRCPRALPVCSAVHFELQAVRGTGHSVRCRLAADLS